jgi:hypothetical protein
MRSWLGNASANSDVVRGGALPGVLSRYLSDLAGQPLAPLTREAYSPHVWAYIDWLAERPGSEAALHQPRARDFAERDFKCHLKLERRGAEFGEPRLDGGRSRQSRSMRCCAPPGT